MKFIHTSDWHIGRQFHHASLLEDQAFVLGQIIAHIKSEQVDALVIAGDIYDRSVPPAAAISLLDQVLDKICNELSVPVILISGNHDGAQRLSFAAKQLQRSGLYILADIKQVTEPVIIAGNYFYGIPYHDPETVRDVYAVDVQTHDQAHNYLVDQIKQVKSPAVNNILISHCFIAGALESDSERSLSVGGAEQVAYQPLVEFDYVALGHLHSPQKKGHEHIRYSGSILKYSFSEHQQEKSISLVEMKADGGFKSVTTLALNARRDMRIIDGDIETILHAGKHDPKADDYLLIRLSDRQAILNPMAKLREVYPNVLHLEKPGMLTTGEQQMNREMLKRGELEMFEDFFQQVSGQAMSEPQAAEIKRVINALNKAEQTQ
ncbi:MAG: exonuclease SbcCD subunit D [Cycloclasticus sp.]